ncbi:MAG: hypothetical protein JWM91_89 [Rhodospirillales bacterium]|nr:hypothetical protein [Rhodospirillales bacterium]
MRLLGFSAIVALAVSIVGVVGCGKSDEPQSSGGPIVVRRLTQEQYQTIIADIFGADIKIGGRFEPDLRKSGLLAVGASEVSVTPAGFEQYDSMARGAAAQIVDERHRDMLIGCKPASPKAPDEACAKSFYSTVGRLLYRRPLTGEELKAQLAIANAAATKLGNFYTGLAMGLTGMVEAPQFLFRREVAEADPDHAGQQRLNAFSKATRLSFFLWNTTPDDELLTAAESGDLNSSRGTAKQVDRMMASPRLTAGARAFFNDMMAFDAFADLSKDTVIYPKFTNAVIADAQEQTLRTITDHLLAAKGDYRDLFTTRKTFMTPLLGTIYRVPVETKEGWEAHEFAADDPRAGLLTQISFLSLHSTPGRSSPTIRGKALREVLLCQKVPDPPGNVNFNLVQDTKNPQFRTARARLGAHATQATCVGCHRLIDPMGLGLEQFDSLGEYRAAENGAPIDASGELDGVKFTDAASLGKALHDNPATPSCLVNRLYAYAAGRPAGKGEAEWIKYLDTSFAANGYRLPDLMRRIVTSDAFYRITAPETATLSVNTAATLKESAQ